MKKVITPLEAAKLISPGSKILVGGFIGCGSPNEVLDAMVENNCNHLHAVCISADRPDAGVGKLIAAGLVDTFEASHIGTNPLAQELYAGNRLKVIFVPQGTLMERLHAAAAGLGGILTPVGLGTIVEQGKDKVHVDGKEFLLEKPLHGDVAIIRARKADTEGNLIYSATARNSGPIMAQAAKMTIAVVDEVVAAGEIDPEGVITPGIFVDYLVLAKRGV